MKTISEKALTIQYKGDIYFNGILMPEKNMEDSLAAFKRTSISHKILQLKSFHPPCAGFIHIDGILHIADEPLPEEEQIQDFYVVAELAGTHQAIEPVHTAIYRKLDDFLQEKKEYKDTFCELQYEYNFYLIESELEILEYRRKHEVSFHI